MRVSECNDRSALKENTAAVKNQFNLLIAPIVNIANCIIIVQILHFSLLFSATILQITPAQSDFQ